jgi:hypothetical protein
VIENSELAAAQNKQPEPDLSISVDVGFKSLFLRGR